MRSEIKKSSGWLERVEVMTSLSDHLEACVAAFRAGDLDAARTALDAGRHERARLMRMRSLSAEGIPETADEISAMRQVGKLAKAIGGADEFLGQVILEHTDHANADELSAAEETHRLIDRALPNSWDLDRDLVVLVGRKALAFYEVLTARGYRRVLVLQESGPQAVDGESEAPGVSLSLDEARTKLEDFKEHPPFQLRLITAGQSVHDSQEVARKIQVWLASLNAGRQTQINFGQSWAMNCIANIPQLLQSTSLQTLQGRFQNLPCVVVAPGPSLSKNIELLVAHRERFVVFAVSHALRSLTQRGITPDFVINVDPQPIVHSFFEGIDTSEIPALIFTVSSTPKLWDVPAKRKVAFTTNSHAENWLEEFGIQSIEVPTGGTVSHAAILCADYLGCSPILLIGQDLAMTGGLEYEQALGETKINEKAKDLIKVEGVNEDVVLTSFQFNQYREWLEELVRQRNDLKIINCTEGGAKIKGMMHSTFSAQIPNTVLSKIEWEEANPVSSEQLLNALKRINARQRSIEEIKRVAKRCLRLCDKMKTDSSAGQSLNAAEEELKRKTREVTEISVYLAKRLKIVEQHSSDLRNMEQALQFSTDLYADLVSACESFENEYKVCANKTRVLLNYFQENS